METDEAAAAATTRRLVVNAARRLGVPLEPVSETWLRDRDDLPAAVAEFLRLLGDAGSQLRRAWFPRDRVGIDVVDEGWIWAERTAQQAGADADVYGDALLLLLSPDGTVVWVPKHDGADPPVLYLTETAQEPAVWAGRFTDWLIEMLPEEPDHTNGLQRL